jgi:hypothetical protein
MACQTRLDQAWCYVERRQADSKATDPDSMPEGRRWTRGAIRGARRSLLGWRPALRSVEDAQDFDEIAAYSVRDQKWG